MKYILTIALLSVMVAYIDAQGRCRGPNEQYLECKPCAAINCGDVPPEVCLAVCANPGCYCKNGFLRKNGRCVPKSQCCSDPNEIDYPCKPCAPTNCGDEDISCIGLCPLGGGCHCKPGYLKKNGKCVPESQCACSDPNETEYICKPCGPLNCGDRTDISCIAQCLPGGGCHCKRGYLRKDGKCVPKNEC